MLKTCVSCGGTFDAKGSSKTCSKLCSAKNTIARCNHPRGPLACVICGDTFEPQHSRVLTCSKSCSRKHGKALERKRRLVKRTFDPTRACVICGGLFEPKTGRHVTCSKKCRIVNFKAYGREYRAAHPDIYARVGRKHYVANRDAVTARGRERYAKNIAARHEYARNFRIKNRAVLLERARLERAKNPWRIQKFYEKNPDYRRRQRAELNIALGIHRELVGRETGDRKRVHIIKKIIEQILGEIPKPDVSAFLPQQATTQPPTPKENHDHD